MVSTVYKVQWQARKERTIVGQRDGRMHKRSLQPGLSRNAARRSEEGAVLGLLTMACNFATQAVSIVVGLARVAQVRSVVDPCRSVGVLR